MEQSTKHHEPQDHSNLAIQATLNTGISNEYLILVAADYLPSKISKDSELKLLHYSFGTQVHTDRRFQNKDSVSFCFRKDSLITKNVPKKTHLEKSSEN